MATIQENKVTPEWVDDLYQIEMTDPVTGGSDGVANRQAKQLAQRTQWLRKEVEASKKKLDSVADRKATGEVHGQVTLTDTLKNLSNLESVVPTPSAVLNAIEEAGVSVSSVEALRLCTDKDFVNVNGYYDYTPGYGGGTFLADYADKTSADNGGTVIVSTDGTRWKREISDTLRFSDFGILPGKNNAHETLKKINTLFRFAYENQIENVINDKPGDYYLNGLIHIGDRLTFKSVAGVRYLRNTSGAMLYNGLVINSESSRENPCRDIKIIGGEFNSNAVEQWSSVNFFSLGYIHGLHIENVIFRDCIRNHAIDLSACEDVVIEDCQFLGFSKEVSTVYGTAPGSDIDRGFSEAIQIDDNVEGTFTGGVLKGDPCINVTIRNNIFGKNPDDKTGLFSQGYGCAVGGHYAARNVDNHSKITIEDNIIADCGYAGIRPFLWDNVKIVGNTFRNNHRNIYVWWLAETNNPSEAGKDYQITNNDFGDTTAEQIITQMFGNAYVGNYAKLSDLVITGNTFGNTSWSSAALLQIQGVNNALICSNLFDVAKRFANIEYSSGVTVAFNRGNELNYEFISSKNDVHNDIVGESRDIYIVGNTAKNSKGGVLYLQKMSDVVVVDNHFFNVAQSSNVNSIRSIDVSGLTVGGNTVMLAKTAVESNVLALAVEASCRDVRIGSFITNSKLVYRDSSAGAGVNFAKIDVQKIEGDNAKLNALTVGAPESPARNLVLNGSMLASGFIRAATPPNNDNSSNLATTAWVNQMNAGNLAASGYQKMTSGLVIQWLTINVNGAASGVATLPISFPNGVLMAVVSDTQDGTSPIHATAWNRSTTSNGAIGWNANESAGLISIMAIGY